MKYLLTIVWCLAVVGLVFGGNTSTVGDYAISVSANSPGQTAVIGTDSFAVKTWYLEVSSSPIVSGGSVSFTVRSNSTWGGTVAVTEPGGGSTYNYTFSSQTGDQTSEPYPGGTGWSTGANTATVGTYTVTLDESSGGGVDARRQWTAHL